MSTNGSRRTWRATFASLLAGFFTGYILASAHWIGGFWLVVLAVVSFAAFIAVDQLFVLAFSWIGGRRTRNRDKGDHAQAKSSVGRKPALALFASGLAIGVVAFRAQLFWSQLETP